MKLKETGLSRRATNALESVGVTTTEELKLFDRSKIKSIRRIGHRTSYEIQLFIDEYLQDNSIKQVTIELTNNSSIKLINVNKDDLIKMITNMYTK